MNFIGLIEDKVYGTIQLWEMREESSDQWNAKPDDSDTNQNKAAERS